MKKIISFLFLSLALLFIVTTCSNTTIFDSQASVSEQVSVEYSASSAPVEVLFSPYDPVQQRVLEVLSEATSEVVIAQYNIRSQNILDKIVELHDAGIAITVVVDKKNADKDYNTGDDFLEDSGIVVVRHKTDHIYGIMHLKVTVIDQQTVMTGSFNWNQTASVTNDENMIIVRNSDVAEIYRNEVLELAAGTPMDERIKEYGEIDDTFAVHFSPERQIDYTIQDYLDNATTSIELAMFTFTNRYISYHLFDAIERGVSVSVIMEEKQGDYTEIDEALEEKECSFIRASNKLSAHSAMHQKYCIIDDRIVITGATNWTISGTKRSEEDIIIIDDISVAAQFKANFYDLQNVYGGIDSTFSGEVTRTSVPVLFRAVYGDTRPGDTVVMVGNCDELGNWDPWSGLRFSTDGGFFPNWFTSADLPADHNLEYKFVTIRSDGSVDWESSDLNRQLEIPATGRAVTISGTYGDTADNWTPANRLTFDKVFDTVYVRGTCNSWESTPMQLIDDNQWQVTITFGISGDEKFKFDILDDWTHNYGDTDVDGILDRSGANISVTPGTECLISLNDLDMTYSVTVE